LISTLELERAAEVIRSARHGMAFTGAGISAESGIPHFRGPGGLWERYDPYQVASIEQFHADPSVYWSYSKNHRRIGAQPNPAHLALTRLEQGEFIESVVTQNTDGLHQRAGSRRVIELHGSSATVECLGCSSRFPRTEIDRLNLERCPPSCPACASAYLKPTVVFFGEPLPVEALAGAQAAAVQADIVLVVGSSLVVYPAASLPRIALEHGARLLIVNAEETPYDALAEVTLKGKAGEILPRLAALVCTAPLI
jgi:NAD-dependent deacetylase